MHCTSLHSITLTRRYGVLHMPTSSSYVQRALDEFFFALWAKKTCYALLANVKQFLCGVCPERDTAVQSAAVAAGLVFRFLISVEFTVVYCLLSTV